MPAPLSLFVVCLPGLEPWLAAEIERLELGTPRPDAGGVALDGDLRTLYRANLELGLASQVLLRLAEFGARSLGELRRKCEPLPWQEWLGGAPHVAVRARCKRSRLYHSDAVAQRVQEAIASRLGRSDLAAEGDEAAVAVHVRMAHDRCTLSLDTSGKPLHRRGWRRNPGKAPVREDLARALVEVLLAEGAADDVPWLDPMAGAGTLVIEAATRLTQRAPGRGRGFAFEHTALLDQALWAAVREAADARVVEPEGLEVFGSDRDPDAVAAAQQHAAAAGVGELVRFECAPLRAAQPWAATPPPARGVLLTHPPYGRRLGSSDRLGALYQTLGHAVARCGPGWRVGLLAGDRRLALRTGLKLRTAFLADHGGRKVRALVGSVSAAE